MNIHKIIKFKISVIILLQIFYKISSLTSFDYPYSITLANDNIFLIQKTGIDIYDKSLNKLNQIIEFSGKEEISEENFAKIAIKYNEKYILSIINDKLFIFNNEGKLLYKDKEKINVNQIIDSYSLTFIHSTNDACYYVIGYFDANSYLNLYVYGYDNKKNYTLLLSKYNTNQYNNQFTYKPKLLSCEYSRYNINYQNFLVFFFNLNSTVGIMVYNILNDDHITAFDDFIEYHNDDEISINKYLKNNLFILTPNIDNSKDITFIKSESNKKRNLSIVWWNFKGDNQTRYFIYDLYSMMYSDLLYSSEMPNTCIKREYDTRINVFPDKNQIAFSCAIEEENVQILLFNKTDLTNNSYIINISCKNNNELSKFYFNNDENFLIYPCFKNCSDKKFKNDIDCLNKKEKEIEEENKKENTTEIRENEKYNKINIIMIIIIIVIIIALLIAFITIFRKYFKNYRFERKKKKEKDDETLMKDILSGFMSNSK